jgi:hypothetical protein
MIFIQDAEQKTSDAQLRGQLEYRYYELHVLV